MHKYFNINKNGHSIKCKIYCENIRSINGVVVFCHGFAGHKDNKAAERFANFILSKYKGIATLTFDLPGHGEDVKKKLCLNDCNDYISLVVNYVMEELNANDIYLYSTSFGGYLALRYILLNGNPFDKIALTCPAIEMYNVINNFIVDSNDINALSKGKSIKLGFDRKVNVDMAFIDSLKENSIIDSDFTKYGDKLLILHGTKDDVVPEKVSEKFTERNDINFIPVENADHRFRDEAIMGNTIKAIVNFFSF